MEAMGTMRDLDQIREQDDAGASSRLMSIALGGLAVACVLFAVGVMVGRESGETRTAAREDPLARLDQLAQQADSTTAAVTYPERLTGATPAAAAAAQPTTPAAQPGVGASVTVPTAAPAPAGDALPVLVGAASPVAPPGMRLSGGFGAPAQSAAPVQGLTGAPIAMPPATGAAPVPAGSEGAFSVQVSSFRSVTAAQGFAQRLRERGHHAFVAQPATAPNGAVWHRVRIGPFATQREATAYRSAFEARERMPTLLVRRDQDTLRPASAPAPQGAAHAPLAH